MEDARGIWQRCSSLRSSVPTFRAIFASGLDEFQISGLCSVSLTGLFSTSRFCFEHQKLERTDVKSCRHNVQPIQWSLFSYFHHSLKFLWDFLSDLFPFLIVVVRLSENRRKVKDHWGKSGIHAVVDATGGTTEREDLGGTRFFSRHFWCELNNIWHFCLLSTMNIPNLAVSLNLHEIIFESQRSDWRVDCIPISNGFSHSHFWCEFEFR